VQNSVISSVREGMRDHLVGSKPSKIVMAKDILYTFTSGSQCGSGRGLAGLLGVDRRNIYQAQSKRMVLDAGLDAFWLQRRRKVRSDSLPEFVKDGQRRQPSLQIGKTLLASMRDSTVGFRIPHITCNAHRYLAFMPLLSWGLGI
jgi:hypothetical protein